MASPGIYPSVGYNLPTGSGFQSWANSTIPGGFDAWRQRQFSSAPFSGPNDPMSYQPGQRVPLGTGGGGQGQQPWQSPSSWDPRSIIGGDAYQQLMSIAKGGTGSTAQARLDAAPAMDYYKNALASGDPLGTQMLPALGFQSDIAALRSAGQTANRRIDESAGGMNASANPQAIEFMRMLAGMQQASGIGEASRGETTARVQERQATAAFQSAVAQALASLSGNLGSLGLQEGGLQVGAAGQAGQLESFARNIWAQLMGSLLQQEIANKNRGFSPSQPLRGRDGYDMNPFIGSYDFGTYLSGRNW